MGLALPESKDGDHLINGDYVYDKMLASIEIYGREKYAIEVGMRPESLNDCIQKRRGIAERILRHLGYERVYAYRRIQNG